MIQPSLIIPTIIERQRHRIKQDIPLAPRFSESLPWPTPAPKHPEEQSSLWETSLSPQSWDPNMLFFMITEVPGEGGKDSSLGTGICRHRPQECPS